MWASENASNSGKVSWQNGTVISDINLISSEECKIKNSVASIHRKKLEPNYVYYLRIIDSLYNLNKGNYQTVTCPIN